MINILFYGNCQIHSLHILFHFSDNYNSKYVLCHETNILKEEFDNLIENQDIIITQSISDNYRNIDYLSTSYLVKTAPSRCKIVILDSFYFRFYYFDLDYRFNLLEDRLLYPCPYHYKSLINCYKKGLSIEFFIKNFVNNINFKHEPFLSKIANEDIQELKRRYNETSIKYDKNENILVLSFYEYIQDNYKKNLLFYTINHPSHLFFHHICESLITILEIDGATIDYMFDPLGRYKGILYKCVQNAVEFNISEYKPLMCDLSCNKLCHINGCMDCKESDVYKISKIYYDSYNKIINFNSKF
jgi:hypothetical protein